MGRISEIIRVANSALRTLLLGALVAGAGFAGWKGYALYNEPQEKLAAKQALLEESQKVNSELQVELFQLSAELGNKVHEIDRLETSLQLLKLKHRIARLHVVEQVAIPDTEKVMTTIEFYEVNEEGAPIDDRRRKFEIEGDRVYVECLIAKFEDRYVEEADLERSTAICLFQRIFGEFQQPQEGFPLDEVGSSPTSYARGGKMSEFEQKIWDDFWEIASNREKAAEIGIRAAHADAPSTRVREGVTYELELRSTGEVTLRPLAEEVASPREAVSGN
ncbi:MAG: hypothetical protein KDA57_15440 [Planctomycetales bacterium]|nr:hypothetical protein [Planctomycetales bacterium]